MEQNIEIKKNENKETILVSPTEAMEILGVGRNKMYCDLLKRNDFPAFRINSKYFVNRLKLQEWADKMCEK
jgi:hypothetical protein